MQKRIIKLKYKFLKWLYQFSLKGLSARIHAYPQPVSLMERFFKSLSAHLLVDTSDQISNAEEDLLQLFMAPLCNHSKDAHKSVSGSLLQSTLQNMGHLR